MSKPSVRAKRPKTVATARPNPAVTAASIRALVEALNNHIDEETETLDEIIESVVKRPVWGKGGLVDASGRSHEFACQAEIVQHLRERLAEELIRLQAEVGAA